MEEALRVMGTKGTEAVQKPLREAIAKARSQCFLASDGFELDEDVLKRLPADATVVRAMGGALAVLSTLLQREGITTVEEIAKALGIYAVVSAETSPAKGLILGCWAGIVGDLLPGAEELSLH